MTSVAIGRMGPSGHDDPEPVVKLTKEPAGLRIELLISNQSSPNGTSWLGRTIPLDLAGEVYEALGFLVKPWGQG